MPDYQIGKRQFTIDDVATNECPASLVSEQSHEYLRIYRRAQLLEVPLIKEIRKWPARLYDAMTILRTEQRRVEIHLQRGVDG
jgi:hypothetical protein